MNSAHNFYCGFERSIRAGGLFIATEATADVGQRVQFDLALVGLPRPVRVSGEVHWLRYASTNDGSPGISGIGVRLDPIASYVILAIERFMTVRDPLFFEDEDFRFEPRSDRFHRVPEARPRSHL